MKYTNMGETYVAFEELDDGRYSVHAIVRQENITYADERSDPSDFYGSTYFHMPRPRREVTVTLKFYPDDQPEKNYLYVRPAAKPLSLNKKTGMRKPK